MRMKILADGTATLYPGRNRSQRRRIRGYPHLFAFLDSLGIGHIEFDPRLEANQVGDLVRLLYAFRRSIRRRQEGRPLPDCISKLLTDEGLRVFCTRARLRDDLLSIEYSYCMTRFSRLVKWFEGWHRRFGDHRALFDAAPRYGLIAAVLGVLGPVVSLISDQRWLMWTVTGVSAVAIFVLIYSFFMTVGSLEYDNEQKAYRLTRAYDQAHRYAERIQNDLQRARAVQAKIIPKIEQLPLHDRLEWAASFQPQAEVGGDYFDAAPIDEHRVAILFSDVSGHGLAAALVTALLKVNFQIWVAEDWDLGRFIAHLYRQLCWSRPTDRGGNPRRSAFPNTNPPPFFGFRRT